MTKTISQREARALKRRVEKLETAERARRSSYATDYPGGVHLGEVSWEEQTHIPSAVLTARRLGHAVVAVSNGSRKFNLYALPHPKDPA